MGTLEEAFEYLEDKGIKAYENKSLSDAEVMFKLCHYMAPDNESVNCNLGNIYLKAGYVDEAIKHLEMGAHNEVSWGNLGAAYMQRGDMKMAGEALQKSLEYKEDYTPALNNLGHVYRAFKKHNKSLDCYLKAFKAKPGQPAFIINVANAYTGMGDLREAERWLLYSLETFPEYGEAWNNLGNIYNKLGEVRKAKDCYDKRLEKKNCVSAAANKALVSLYDLNNDPISQLKITRDCMSVLDGIPHLELSEYNHEKPRVGFLSAHFGTHPVGFFTLGLFRGNEELDYYVYSNRYEENHITEEIKSLSHFRKCHGMTEDALCKTIMDDEIDILIDLGGLGGKNHITVFKRKPAPVQVAWVGYAGTRGLDEIDYILTDWYHTPLGFEDHYAENPLRMPNDYVTYSGPEFEIKKKKRPFTYIAAHNSAKINDRVLSLWGRILQQTPGTRLLMAYSGLRANEERIKEFLGGYGIDRDRIVIHDRLTHPEMMDLYNEADLCLDTYPYSAGLVACESLWMGVPVVTLPSNMFSGRHAMSHLANVDLREFVCENERQYIDKAVEFYNRGKSPFLPQYIRENMKMSPLMDYQGFAHNFNAKMWEIWK